MKLTAKAIKATLVVDPIGLFGTKIPEGGPSRTTVEIIVGSRKISANLATKSVRKAIAAAQAGDCVVIIQGRLEGETIGDAPNCLSLAAPILLEFRAYCGEQAVDNRSLYMFQRL